MNQKKLELLRILRHVAENSDRPLPEDLAAKKAELEKVFKSQKSID